MNAKPLLLIPALSLVLLLSACAGPMPQPDPKEAWISLEEEGPSDLLAERVDGKNVDDGRYFEVQPGAHRLDVTLFEEVGGDSNQVDCHGHVSYPNFQAGSITSWWNRPWAPRCGRGCLMPRASRWRVRMGLSACRGDRAVGVAQSRKFRSIEREAADCTLIEGRLMMVDYILQAGPFL